MSYCDGCGSKYISDTSKYCSDCGLPRTFVDEPNHRELTIVERNEIIRREDVVEKNWTLLQFPELSLYDRVFGPRPSGLSSSVKWGRNFLKQHYEYSGQYRKLKHNQKLVRKWFAPGTNELVDLLYASSSLRWDKKFQRRLERHFCAQREIASAECRKERLGQPHNQELVKNGEILGIFFPKECKTLHWKISDVMKYVFEMKHYRRSPRSVGRHLGNPNAISLQRDNRDGESGGVEEQTLNENHAILPETLGDATSDFEEVETGTPRSNPSRQRRLPTRYLNT